MSLEEERCMEILKRIKENIGPPYNNFISHKDFNDLLDVIATVVHEAFNDHSPHCN